MNIPCCISANDYEFYADPPTFKSHSNTGTLCFTSNNRISDNGILMAYVLGKYLIFFYWLFIVNINPFKDVSFKCTGTPHGQNMFIILHRLIQIFFRCRWLWPFILSEWCNLCGWTWWLHMSMQWSVAWCQLYRYLDFYK